ncbi:MAG: hypothetical protein ABI432_09160 [Flavobacteriales bacterium]
MRRATPKVVAKVVKPALVKRLKPVKKVTVAAKPPAPKPAPVVQAPPTHSEEAPVLEILPQDISDAMDHAMVEDQTDDEGGGGGVIGNG